MNVAYSDRGPVAYDDPAPLILAASSPQAGRRARRMLDQSGARIGAELPIDQALERLDRQVAASAVWVEVDEDAGGALDDLLHQIARDVGDGRYAAVVSTSRDIVDQVVFGLGDSAIEILVDADEIERAAALAIATSHAARGQRLSDVAADGSAEQLRQLTAEVNRIAGMLSRLSDGPAAAPRAPEKSDAGDKPEVSVETRALGIDQRPGARDVADPDEMRPGGGVDGPPHKHALALAALLGALDLGKCRHNRPILIHFGP